MSNFQTQKINVMSEIFLSRKNALESLHRHDYCFYLEHHLGYPQIKIIISDASKENRIQHYFQQQQQKFPSFVFIKQEDLSVNEEFTPRFTLPLSRQNFNILKKIFKNSPTWDNVTNYYLKMIERLPEQFLEKYVQSMGYDFFQQIYQYARNHDIHPVNHLNYIHIIQGIDEQAIQSLQLKLLNDPVSPIFINHEHRIILNDLITEELHFLFKENPKLIIQQYEERFQNEQLTMITSEKRLQSDRKLGFYSDIFLCSVILPAQHHSIFSPFQIGLFNEQNQIYNRHIGCESFQKRIKKDIHIQNLDLPRFSEIFSLLEIQSDWDITQTDTLLKPINPWLGAWQYGLHYIPINLPLKLMFLHTRLEKLNDKRLATHVLSLPYSYFQMMVLFFNCTYNPLLFKQLIELIDSHLENHLIQTIPSSIIELIGKKYAERARFYQKINQAYFQKEIFPEIQACLLHQAKQQILTIQTLNKKNLPHEKNIDIMIYDAINLTYSTINLQSTNPYAYVFQEILKLKNPANFNASWVHKKKRHSLHQMMHKLPQEELF